MCAVAFIFSINDNQFVLSILELGQLPENLIALNINGREVYGVFNVPTSVVLF